MIDLQIHSMKKSPFQDRKGLGLEKGVVQVAAQWLAERWASKSMAEEDWLEGLARTVLQGKEEKGINASRYMIHDLVNEFRSFMERLRSYGIRVPSLSDEQIARTLERAMGEADRMEFGRKGIETKGADELLRMWQAGPANWTNGDITRNVGQLTNEEATKLGQAMNNDSDKYTRQQIRQAFEHRFESWSRIQFRSVKSIVLPDERQNESWSCGAAAVVSVCRYFGIEPNTESEAIRELGSSPSDGTNPNSIIAVLEFHGLEVDARDWFDLDVLNKNHLEKGHPVLAPIQMYGSPEEYETAQGGHWVVIEGVRDRKVCLQDPVAGQVEMDVEEFKSRWHDQGADGTPYEKYGIACWKKIVPNLSPTYQEEKSFETWYTEKHAFHVMRPSPFLKRKGLEIATKDGGTCKQGERADLTGCTPDSGESGRGGSSKPEAETSDADKAKQRDVQNIKEALKKAEEAGKKKQVQQLREMLRGLEGSAPTSKESTGDYKEFKSKKDMDKWGKENFTKWKDGLDQAEKKALLQYAGPMFFDSNSALRSGESVPEKWKESVEALDRAIDKSTIPEDIVSYRGLWLDGKEQSKKFIEKFVPGAVLSDPGFMSTSINREIASDFGGEQLGSGIVIELRIPKGTKGAYMDVLPENAKHFKQNEVLLGRGTKFKVVSVEKGKAVVEVVNE